MNSIAGIFRTCVLPVNGGKCEELRICEIANMSHLGTIDTCVKLSYIFQNITISICYLFSKLENSHEQSIQSRCRVRSFA